MEVLIRGDAKEIAALVSAIQERRMNFKGSPKDLAENLANDLKARCGKEREVQSKLSS